MSRPEDFNAILDAVETLTTRDPEVTVERPFLLGGIPPQSSRAIVTIEGRSYFVTVEAVE